VTRTLETGSDWLDWLLLMRLAGWPAGWLLLLAVVVVSGKLRMGSETPRYRAVAAEVGRKVTYCVLTMLTLRR